MTAAHVVAGAADVAVGHPDGTYAVPGDGVRAEPARSDGGRFFPYPDLAVLRIAGWDGHPVAALAAYDPEPQAEVAALGYSPHTPSPGVHPDSLALRVAGRSGSFLRVLGDGVREGFSGSMLVDGDGLVVGVLKGSRSYADAQSGWFTPVSALRPLLGMAPAPPGPAAAPAPAPALAPPGDAELVDALMAFPALARADGRYDLLDRMGDHLALPASFEAEERAARRDHLFRLVRACRHFRDERSALRALHTAMEELAPYDKALERLRELVGRAAGWGDA